MCLPAATALRPTSTWARGMVRLTTMSTLLSARRSSTDFAVTPNSAALRVATSGRMSAMPRISRTGKSRIAVRHWLEMLPAPMMPTPRRCRAAMCELLRCVADGAARPDAPHVLAGTLLVTDELERGCEARTADFVCRPVTAMRPHAAHAVDLQLPAAHRPLDRRRPHGRAPDRLHQAERAADGPRQGPVAGRLPRGARAGALPAVPGHQGGASAR